MVTEMVSIFSFTIGFVGTKQLLTLMWELELYSDSD